MRRWMPLMALVLLAPQQVEASFAPVPLEVMVDEANLIVAGTVDRIVDAGFGQPIGNRVRPYDAAVVTVKSTLKGPKKKEVRIAQPSKGGGVAISTDIRFRKGQQGIWLLKWDPHQKIYWATHPIQYQQPNQQKLLEKTVLARNNVPAGKSLGGLVARAEAFKQGDAVEVRLSLKNISDKPLAVCKHVGQRPIQITWIGPDDKKNRSHHYDWLARVRLRPPSKEDFVTIPPGGIRYFGPRNGYNGILFASQNEGPGSNVAKPGKHTVTVSYTTEISGKRFGIDKSWTGTVTSKPVLFTVK